MEPDSYTTLTDVTDQEDNQQQEAALEFRELGEEARLAALTKKTTRRRPSMMTRSDAPA